MSGCIGRPPSRETNRQAITQIRTVYGRCGGYDLNHYLFSYLFTSESLTYLNHNFYYVVVGPLVSQIGIRLRLPLVRDGWNLENDNKGGRHDDVDEEEEEEESNR